MWISIQIIYENRRKKFQLKLLYDNKIFSRPHGGKMHFQTSIQTQKLKFVHLKGKISANKKN
jgi:hypothetical protein